MAKQVKRNEMVEVEGEDTYYKVDVTLDSETQGKAWVPEHGRVEVEKRMEGPSWDRRPSFAWHVRK